MDTSLKLKLAIICKYEDGQTIRAIASDVNVPRSTVADIIKRYRENGNQISSVRKNCGTTRILTPTTDRSLFRASVKNPRATARELRMEISGPALSVSIRTIQRSLVRSGRIAYRPLKSPFLTKPQQRVRYQWAIEHRSWTLDMWKKVSHRYGRIIVIMSNSVLSRLYFLMKVPSV